MGGGGGGGETRKIEGFLLDADPSSTKISCRQVMLLSLSLSLSQPPLTQKERGEDYSRTFFGGGGF